jgi:hypothetical protein
VQEESLKKSILQISIGSTTAIALVFAILYFVK